MVDQISTSSPNAQTETLESAIKKFADELPYWSKFLADKRLSGTGISDEDIDTAYACLSEELGLIEKTERPGITVNYNPDGAGRHRADLLFTKLENVEGVNALIEGQKLEFGPSLTIIYGLNGSGKSGYTRLLKQVFHSKSREEILPNVHLNGEHKPIGANFLFVSGSTEIPLTLKDRTSAEFEQFSVFDGKSVVRHLDQKNEFEFRPAGLSFFGEMSSAIGLVERKLEADLVLRKSSSTPVDLSILFDGDSEIKTAVIGINATTKISDLTNYTPFTEEDKTQQSEKTKNHDDLLVASKNTDKEIKLLENIKKLLSDNKLAIDKLNKYFITAALDKINANIKDCLDKEEIARAEGSQKFYSDSVHNIGGDEWKEFILSAEKFARTQRDDEVVYPEEDDNCLLCHQPLAIEARKLITDYWVFIKSLAEENARKAQEVLKKNDDAFSELKFDLIPEENVLVVWMAEHYPDRLKEIASFLQAQSGLRDVISECINNKKSIHNSKFRSKQNIIMKSRQQSMLKLKN